MAYKIEDFQKWYLDAKDIKNVENIACFDPLRKQSYIELHESAVQEKDQAKQHEALFNLYNRLKQDLSYFIGLEGIKPTGKTSKIQENVTNGLKALEEVLK